MGSAEGLDRCAPGLQDAHAEPARLLLRGRIPSLVAAAGEPALDLTLAGVTLTVILWVFFRPSHLRGRRARAAALISLAAVYGHDLVAAYLAPLAVSLTLHLRGRPLTGALVALLLVLFFVPSRWVCQSGVPLLDQWRSAILVVFLGWVLRLSARHVALQRA